MRVSHFLTGFTGIENEQVHGIRKLGWMDSKMSLLYLSTGL